MMLLAPWEFTPSEQAYAAHSPSWGPFGVEKYHHFVRTTLTIRNEPPGVAPGDPAFACETLIKEGKAKIVDLASGSRNARRNWTRRPVSRSPMTSGGV